MELPFGIQPEQLNVINPVLILIFIPLFDKIIYPHFERQGVNICPLRRMAWGMMLSAGAFFLSGMVETAIQHNVQNELPKVNVFWQLPQITVLSIAEILLSVTGLEFAYSMSPNRLKAFVTALFLSTTAIGDSLSGILFSTVFAHMNMSTVMHVCALLMLANLWMFCKVAKWYKNQAFLQGDQRQLSTDEVELTS
jgi:dipeptide/tripeptide permease